MYRLRRSILFKDPITVTDDAKHMKEFVYICKKNDIPNGEARMILVNELAFGIFNVSGTFFAIDDACPNAGASLSLGFFEGDVVRCRIHHWRFCVRNGVYLDEMKPSCNVRHYPTRVVGEQVQIEIDKTFMLHCNPQQDFTPT